VVARLRGYTSESAFSIDVSANMLASARERLRAQEAAPDGRLHGMLFPGGVLFFTDYGRGGEGQAAQVRRS
jgi:hypothetical protein